MGYWKRSGLVSDKKYKDLLKEESKNSKEIVKIIQFAVNTVAYMNTFPGCVIDGVPEIIKKQPFYNDNSLYVDISDKIVDYSENTNIGKKVSPHFRRGYFKRLTAERYTKMRGKLIFVHETMVNGKAKTIYTSDELEKMEQIDGT